MLEATLALGVSRETVLQRVERGELQAVHVRSGAPERLANQGESAGSESLFEDDGKEWKGAVC